jgi:sec-independent protein translocase protein TatA
MPFQLGLPEMILVIVIALVVLGPKRLPQAARQTGRGIREFKDALSMSDGPSAAGRAGDAAPRTGPPRYTPPRPYEPPQRPLDPDIYVPHAELMLPPVNVTEGTSPEPDAVV